MLSISILQPLRLAILLGISTYMLGNVRAESTILDLNRSLSYSESNIITDASVQSEPTITSNTMDNASKMNKSILVDLQN
jgi:hypothetical protein